MTRKHLTEIFPWLLPLRRRQRIFSFYRKMKRGGSVYAVQQQDEPLPYMLFETRCPMINGNTGFDIKYQENKVFNLKLAAKKLNGLLIRPGETFSFYQAIRYADRDTPYKDGLAEINGRLTTEYGGGLCMLSNLLFWTLLHAPLSIIERHGHREKDFPEPPSDALYGVDAAVAEGWLDLKFKNETELCFQLGIEFEKEQIIGRVLSSGEPGIRYELINGVLSYERKDGRIYEKAPVIRRKLSPNGELLGEEELYTNMCIINYRLPEETEIEEK